MEHGKQTDQLLRNETLKKGKKEVEFNLWRGEPKPTPGYEIIRGSSFCAVRCNNQYLYKEDLEDE